MQILYGDEEEHAVLLTNFFLGLGKQAYLILGYYLFLSSNILFYLKILYENLGTSITEGDSAFCMSLENNEYYIWYAGRPYKVKEPHNPVRIISALVNSENVRIIILFLLQLRESEIEVIML